MNDESTATVKERWPTKTVVKMHDEFMQGKSLRELGDEQGVSHEGIRQVFVSNDLPTKRTRQSTVKRYAARHAAWEAKEEIWASYRKHGNIPAVAEEVSMSTEIVGPVIDKMPMREIYTHRRSGHRYTKEEAIVVLRKVAKFRMGEPLTQPNYQAAVAKHNRIAKPEAKWPTRPTIVKLFGDFATACKAAGVEHNPSKGMRRDSYTAEDCKAAIRQCQADLGHIPRYEDYVNWARKNKGYPSGPTVRVRVQLPWREIVQEALRTDGVGYPE